MVINRRVEAIRRKSKEERSKIAALGEQVVDPDARRLLTDRATKLLDDVDQFFLSTDILREPRTDAALARWLDHAETVLHRAIAARESAEAVEQSFFPR